ncbi:nitrate ABC transporter permease [Aquirhabdus sp.]|uniref:nitrate ABC transporter permease n=1 Tax=Aquirhabdus sp. TaxID=2824160 RepID=UPI00396C7965
MSNDTNATSVDAVTLDVAKIATSADDVHDTKDLITPVEKKESESVKRMKEGLVSIIKVIIPPMIGIALFLFGWTLLSQYRPTLPNPWVTFLSALELFSHPFYVESANDQGIGWNILSSLGRVGTGFGLAALIGIPLGFIIGRVKFMQAMLSPIISILRPVSPLAWLPIGMVVFQAANPASIWVIFISSIWPIILNTSAGVSQVPQDYLNVARVLRLSEWKVFTKILLPASLPYLLTGIRLSVGVAWLVIVAAEMVSGGKGIGFWVWDEYQNSQYAHIIVGIFVVGILGLIIEQLLILITKLISRGETTS